MWVHAIVAALVGWVVRIELDRVRVVSLSTFDIAPLSQDVAENGVRKRDAVVGSEYLSDDRFRSVKPPSTEGSHRLVELDRPPPLGL